MQFTLRQFLAAVFVMFLVVYLATTLALRNVGAGATDAAKTPSVDVSESSTASGPSVSLAPSDRIDSTAIELILAQLDSATREQVLDSSAAFSELVGRETQRRAVINAAIDTGFYDGEAVQSLMARAAERVLGEAYLAQVVDGNLDPSFPSEQQLAQWFEKNSARFGVPERVHLWQIFLSLPADADTATVEAMRQQAASYANASKAGPEAFRALAIEHSDHAQSRVNGGYMGLLPLSRVKPELREAVAALETGSVSPPLRTEAGFHVVLRGDTVPGFSPELAEVEGQARAAMLQEARAAIRQAALKKIQETYPVTADATAVETWRLELLMNRMEQTQGLVPNRPKVD